VCQRDRCADPAQTGPCDKGIVFADAPVGAQRGGDLPGHDVEEDLQDVVERVARRLVEEVERGGLYFPLLLCGLDWGGYLLHLYLGLSRGLASQQRRAEQGLQRGKKRGSEGIHVDERAEMCWQLGQKFCACHQGEAG
jgi:hypothetical protein